MYEFTYLANKSQEVPDFSDLPWGLQLVDWSSVEPRLEEIQHGISRHPVVFVNYAGILYVVKELPVDVAKREFDLLTEMHRQGLPCVIPIGYASLKRGSISSSILFTRYLVASVPFRSLFIGNVIERYQAHLLDAISGLLVQLHSSGFYWGDCSLSNILFRRDAGALQAYLVDAETAEFQLPRLAPVLRYHDLEIMQENIVGELTDLQAEENLPLSYPIEETGSYIQQRYRELWEEITREEIIHPDEQYRIQERIRALNSLGFSVRDIELNNEDHGNRLKFRIFVSDRNFHRNQLIEITGIYAEEHQAQQIINEIYELKANLSSSGNPNITLEAVAFHWLEHIYKPVIELLEPMLDNPGHPRLNVDPIEIYCQILEHKWYMSEQAHHDVGHQAATEDFIRRFGKNSPTS
jgi:tRNA A-37 threonylcarbamoyl transferase component Bud32